MHNSYQEISYRDRVSVGTGLYERNSYFTYLFRANIIDDFFMKDKTIHV